MTAEHNESFPQYLRRHSILIAAVYLLTAAAFGVWAAHDIVTFDAEGLYSLDTTDQWYGMWLQVGRWSLLLLKKAFHTMALNPYFSVAMFLLLFPLSAVLWAYVLQRFMGGTAAEGKQEAAGSSVASAKPEWLTGAATAIFCAVYVTHPVWAYQFAYRNQMDVIVVPMVLLPAGVLLFHQWLEGRGVLRGLAALLIVTFCFGAYQSFLFVFADAFLMERLLSVPENRRGSRRRFWRETLQGVLFTLAAFLLYRLIWSLSCSAFDIPETSQYLDSQFMWGSRSAGENLAVICSYIREGMFGGDFAGSAYNGLYGVASIAGLVILIGGIVARRDGAWTRLLFFAGIWAMPFALEMVTAGSIVTRSQFSFVLSLAFLTAEVVRWAGAHLVRIRRLPAWAGQAAFLLVLAAAVLPQLQVQTRLLYSDVQTMERDKESFENIYYRAMELGAQEDDAICFVGRRQNYSDDSLYNDDEVIGYSYLEFTGDRQKVVQAMRAYGYQVTVPDEAQAALAQQEAGDMHLWPEKDSVRVLPEQHLIVVRLQ